MNGEQFELAVHEHVAPALLKLGFELQTSISGKIYSAEFLSPRLIVSVSFEPGDDYFLVVVFTVSNGHRSDIDDRSTTPRLSDLNSRFLTAADSHALARIRSGQAIGSEEQRIRRIGAELSLVLPRYMDILAIAHPGVPPES